MPGLHPPAAARHDVRQRVHQRVHVLAGALDAHVRLLPGPARRQVHARDGHARAEVPAGRARRPRLHEPRHGDARPRATRRSTRASSTAPSRPNGSTWVPSDVNQYGFTRWNPPDAGANQTVPEEGGGIYDNDGRFMNSQGTAGGGHRGRRSSTSARRPPSSQPFFMVVSLVNPHDVLFYPKNYRRQRATTTRGWTARSSRRRPPTRTCRPSRRCRRSSWRSSTSRARSRRGR